MTPHPCTSSWQPSPPPTTTTTLTSPPRTSHTSQFTNTTNTMAGAHPIHIHPARPLYRVSAKLLGASMWFWVMYRAKKDGAVLMGWRHPWEH